MGDTFIDTGDVSQVTTAYNRLSYFRFRSNLFFDMLASVKPTNQSHPGSPVQFNIWNDMAPAITPLSEKVDVTPVDTTDSTVTLALNEYGNATRTTARVRALSFLPISQDVANIIGFNAGLSFDCLARNVAVGGTNVRFANGAANRAALTSASSHFLRAGDIRDIVAIMRDNNVPDFDGFYRAFGSAATVLDLREETGAASWRDPMVYGRSQADIWNGEIGAFEGVKFVETPQLTAGKLEAAQGGPGGYLNGGAGATMDVFPTLIFGREAIAKTWSKTVSASTPQVVVGEVTDLLRRFAPIGWYWMGGFGRFREEAIWRIESATSLWGASAPTS